MTHFDQLRHKRGTSSSNLPHVLHVLPKKTLPSNNIAVGIDVPQLQFIQRHLKTTAKPVGRVTDDMLAGYDGQLYHVAFPHNVDLSPEFRQRTGIWALGPITKGSSAMHTLVKFAATLLDLPENSLKRETIDWVGEELLRREIVDIYVVLLQAVWILSGDPPTPKVAWKEPWEHPTEWLTLEMNVNRRLNVLYRTLVGYAQTTTYGAEAATKYGVTPAQQEHFKSLQLDLKRVYLSIKVLSIWKQADTCPYNSAVQVAAIWS